MNMAMALKVKWSRSSRTDAGVTGLSSVCYETSWSFWEPMKDHGIYIYIYMELCIIIIQYNIISYNII